MSLFTMRHYGSRMPSKFMSTLAFDGWTRAQLVKRIMALESLHPSIPVPVKPSPAPPARYCDQRVAFKVAYLGWNYHGFAEQDSRIPTVEREIFRALRRTQLIAEGVDCHYTRCGRTDKGVSGLGQVIALNIRTPCDTHREIPYLKVLNRRLPEDIRMIAWAPVSASFHARFDCRSRTYRYMFARQGMDVDRMREAASLLLGTHDFRNFCKLDPSKMVHYERTMHSIDLYHLHQDFWYAEVKGSAFLWHQVRCMMSVLFLVGQGLEPPSIIRDLLDVATVTAKPDYPLASDLPLLFYDCEFKERIEWTTNDKDQHMHQLEKHWDQLRSQHHVRLWLLDSLKEQAQCKTGEIRLIPDTTKTLIHLGAGETTCMRRYQPLLKRPRADSDQVKKQKHKEKLERKARELEQKDGSILLQ